MAETKLLSKIRKLPDNRECACCGVKSASPLGFMQVCPKVRLAAVLAIVALSYPMVRSFNVRLRWRSSDRGYDPMVSPTLCPTLPSTRKSRFFPLLTVFAVGIGRMRTSSVLSRRVLLAIGKWLPRRGGMTFAARC